MDTRAASTPLTQPPARAGAFSFLDLDNLVDEELELVQPDYRWVDPVVVSVSHPATQCSGEDCTGITRDGLQKFLQAAPRGHEPADVARRRVPVYHFWMRLRPEYHPPIPMAGAVCIRIGSTRDLEMYFGHIGYGVYPPAQGRRLAERACRLILPLAAYHHLNPLWITTDPENQASRRTCERLGAELIEIVSVPADHPLHARGQVRKCRYRLGV